jgi:hypothetical protein
MVGGAMLATGALGIVAVTQTVAESLNIAESVTFRVII